jgi:hypothetical protein
LDADQAMDAQAHRMRDLLRDFGDVPLALVAYNAGPAPVRACGCVRACRRFPRPAPAWPTSSAGATARNPLSTGATGLEVRLVRRDSAALRARRQPRELVQRKPRAVSGSQAAEAPHTRTVI